MSATGIRHGIQFSQGNSHFLVDGFDSASSFDDGLDCHGARNQHGVLSNFTVQTSCKIGNTSYPAGDQDISIINGTCGESLKVQGGSQVTATNIIAQNLLLQTIAGFPKYYPHDCTYTNCSFNNSETSESNNCLYLDCDEGTAGLPVFRQATNQRFYGCSFNQLKSDPGNWCVFFIGVDNPTDFQFDDCAFESAAPQSLVEHQFVSIPIGPGPEYRLALSFSRCGFVSTGSTQFAITFKANSVAGIALVDCSFTTSGTSPGFVSGLGPTISEDANDDNVINP